MQLFPIITPRLMNCPIRLMMLMAAVSASMVRLVIDGALLLAPEYADPHYYQGLCNLLSTVIDGNSSAVRTSVSFVNNERLDEIVAGYPEEIKEIVLQINGALGSPLRVTNTVFVTLSEELYNVFLSEPAPFGVKTGVLLSASGDLATQLNAVAQEWFPRLCQPGIGIFTGYRIAVISGSTIVTMDSRRNSKRTREVDEKGESVPLAEPVNAKGVPRALIKAVLKGTRSVLEARLSPGISPRLPRSPAQMFSNIEDIGASFGELCLTGSDSSDCAVSF